ncbi:hypothetical protein BCR44DRAFT_1423773 [Catenaria anguillulae PL171]|uniref:Uncharacterized protein n=1 Tax=Catenaria anguillulae PL171 TaxID=765915 RepID=A0A1Y2I1P0_9FUNG|nr:hypothetical protein BCR44DRAFT_1423773 [Catenaria anguillulae PL171]
MLGRHMPNRVSVSAATFIFIFTHLRHHDACQSVSLTGRAVSHSLVFKMRLATPHYTGSVPIGAKCFGRSNTCGGLPSSATFWSTTHHHASGSMSRPS